MCFTVLTVVACSDVSFITKSFVVDERKVFSGTIALVNPPAELAVTDDSDEFSGGSVLRPTEPIPVRPQSSAKTVPWKQSKNRTAIISGFISVSIDPPFSPCCLPENAATHLMKLLSTPYQRLLMAMAHLPRNPSLTKIVLESTYIFGNILLPPTLSECRSPTGALIVMMC